MVQIAYIVQTIVKELLQKKKKTRYYSKRLKSLGNTKPKTKLL